MKYIILLIVTLSIFSCNKNIMITNSTSNKPHINNIYEEINFFKYIAFQDCLKKGYNSSVDITNILKEEINLTDFPFNLKTRSYLDSLATGQRQKIISDSIYLKKNWLLKNTDFESLSGKRVIAHCLNFYISEELDSLVQIYYK